MDQEEMFAYLNKFCCDTFGFFAISMQQSCRNNFCPARIVEDKVFLLKLFDLGCGSSADIEINEEIFSHELLSSELNFLSSANFDFHTKILFDQTMHQWCRNNFCPARFAEETLFLLKLFILAFHFFSSHWINEEIFSHELLSSELNFLSSANFDFHTKI